MKKFILFVSVVALVACAEKDTFKETNEIPVGFTKVYIENGTRAINKGPYTTDNFETVGNTFGVFGFKQTDTQTDAVVFTNQKVEYQTGLSTSAGYQSTTDWAYSPIKYWDKSATQYNFYAYAPYDGDFTGTAALDSQSENDFSITGFKQAHTKADMIDLMTDLSSKKTVSGNSIGTNDVAFVFSHILSNINIEMALSQVLKNDSVANPVTVDSIAIGTIKMDGDYKYVTNAYAWSLATTPTTADFLATQNNKIVFPSNTLWASNKKYLPVPGLTDLLFVPQTVDNAYKIYVRYLIKDEIYEKNILLSDFKKDNASLSTWEAGKKYTYRIIIGPNPILFDFTGVTDWADGGTYTYTIE